MHHASSESESKALAEARTEASEREHGRNPGGRVFKSLPMGQITDWAWAIWLAWHTLSLFEQLVVQAALMVIALCALLVVLAILILTGAIDGNQPVLAR